MTPLKELVRPLPARGFRPTVTRWRRVEDSLVDGEAAGGFFPRIVMRGMDRRMPPGEPPVSNEFLRSSFLAVGGALAGLLAGLGAGAILACVYAYVILYFPAVGLFTIGLTAGFGGLVGFVAGYVLKWFKVRNLDAMHAVTTLVTLNALYLSWAVWVFAFLQGTAEETGLSTLLSQPGTLWVLIVKINAEGAWTIGSREPKGTSLGILWAIEAVIIVLSAFLVAEVQIRDEPVCNGIQLPVSKLATAQGAPAGDPSAGLAPRRTQFDSAAHVAEAHAILAQLSPGFRPPDSKATPAAHDGGHSAGVLERPNSLRAGQVSEESRSPVVRGPVV